MMIVLIAILAAAGLALIWRVKRREASANNPDDPSALLQFVGGIILVVLAIVVLILWLAYRQITGLA